MFDNQVLLANIFYEMFNANVTVCYSTYFLEHDLFYFTVSKIFTLIQAFTIFFDIVSKPRYKTNLLYSSSL